MSALRLITYLWPGLLLGFYRLLADELAARLIQPVVARAGLPLALREAITRALLALADDARTGAALATHGVIGFVTT